MVQRRVNIIFMKIVSFNVRGLGGRVKKRELKKLVNREKLDMMCIQETKLENISQRTCRAIWAGDDFEWCFLPSAGRSGGILCLWRDNSFQLRQSFIGTNFIGLIGRWGNDFECAILFVYSPCDGAGKRRMWVEILERMKEFGGQNWCVAGDFNEVTSPAERKGVGVSGWTSDMEEFQAFIDEARLNDLPLVGRRYMWLRQNGTAMSRLDRFLLSDGWMSRWPNLTQWGMSRDFSDHCPVMLKESIKDWGPTPFRVWDHWSKEPGFKELVSSCWNSFRVSGKAYFILKEKLKMLKARLKEWNKEQRNRLEKETEIAALVISRVDKKGEDGVLDATDIEDRRQATTQWWSLSRKKENALIQTSRIQWFREGDCNSAFFHKVIQGRSKSNEIHGLWIEARFVEPVQDLKESVYTYFELNFKEEQWPRPELDGVQLRKLDREDNVFLTAPFSIEEIKKAMWSCGGQKSPGPDGFNFNFIKQNWEVLTNDFSSFLNEFHHNGKMVKGSNSSFLVLISKVITPSSLKISDQYHLSDACIKCWLNCWRIDLNW